MKGINQHVATKKPHDYNDEHLHLQSTTNNEVLKGLGIHPQPE